jgi:hypothetical protein
VGAVPAKLGAASGVALLFLCEFSASASAQLGNLPVHIQGNIDCGKWLASREQKTSIAFEHYVLGMLNGLTIGADREFWNADGRAISWDAVYFWIDGYCRSHPTDLLSTAAVTLFKERTKLQ